MISLAERHVPLVAFRQWLVPRVPQEPGVAYSGGFKSSSSYRCMRKDDVLQSALGWAGLSNSVDGVGRLGTPM